MKKVLDIIKKIIFIITDVLITLLIIVWLYYIFQVNINKVEKEKVFNHNIFIVETGSMADAININDLIIVKQTENINQNDIIAFKQDGDLIVHRIVEKKNDEIITKGDANNQEDEPIKTEQVIGKVVKVFSFRSIILIILSIIILNIFLVLIKELGKIKERPKINNEK